MKRLRVLTDKEIAEITPKARASRIPLDTCPTCKSELEYVEDEGGFSRIEGTYTFRGNTYDCDCVYQIQLRKHYLLANIPEQYQRLDWDDYDGSQEAQEAVRMFLDKWQGFSDNGVGIEFCGKGLGTGKTFAATHIGKELVKQNIRVYFISFRDLISIFYANDTDEIAKLKNSPVLILDEVGKFTTQKQEHFYAELFEDLIRHRTNWNAITIMTTNIEEDLMRELYPRVYSLIEGKQLRVTLEGDDARMAKVGMENVELAANMEIRPIT